VALKAHREAREALCARRGINGGAGRTSTVPSCILSMTLTVSDGGSSARRSSRLSSDTKSSEASKPPLAPPRAGRVVAERVATAAPCKHSACDRPGKLQSEGSGAVETCWQPRRSVNGVVGGEAVQSAVATMGTCNPHRWDSETPAGEGGQLMLWTFCRAPQKQLPAPMLW
jgi:hypothetical protein